MLVTRRTVAIFYTWALAVLNFKVRTKAVRSREVPLAYFKAVSGEGCYLIDAAGKRYFDGSGGAAVVGVADRRPIRSSDVITYLYCYLVT